RVKEAKKCPRKVSNLHLKVLKAHQRHAIIAQENMLSTLLFAPGELSEAACFYIIIILLTHSAFT
ncbi:hypothetical protein, partial [Enterobacter hormaechei]|uniref:hypothetical protein n=1 Tax=Enterobacter hormaechei TaxID=158836 RepID=UPI001CC328A3